MAIALLVTISLIELFPMNVMADKIVDGTLSCTDVTPGYTVECCAYVYNETPGSGHISCTTCAATNPPSNCTPRYPASQAVNDNVIPDIPTEGVSDDPNASDDPNPGIPSQGGVVGEPTESDGQNQNQPKEGITPKDPFTLEEGVFDGGQTAPPVNGGLESLLTEQTQQETEQQQQTDNGLNSLLETQEQDEQQPVIEEQRTVESETEEQNQTLTLEVPRQCQDGQITDDFGNCVTPIPEITEQPTEDEGQEGNNTDN